MQQIIENKLSEALDMTFLSTEYVTDHGSRIGTLAIDSHGAPVVIMYKKTRNDNIIGQSISNAKWLQTQKPVFFKKMLGDRLGVPTSKSIHLNWDALRIVCIAEAFSRVDLDTAAVLSTPIELFNFRPHANNAFALTPVCMGLLAA